MHYLQKIECSTAQSFSQNKIPIKLVSMIDRPVERGERGESFSGPRDVWGAPPTLKNTENGVPDGFFLI